MKKKKETLHLGYLLTLWNNVQWASPDVMDKTTKIKLLTGISQTLSKIVFDIDPNLKKELLERYGIR